MRNKDSRQLQQVAMRQANKEHMVGSAVGAENDALLKIHAGDA